MTTPKTPLDIRIANATQDDIPAMVDLLATLFSIEEDFQADTTKQCRGLQMLMASAEGVIKVARYQNKVIGMVTAQLVVSTAEGAKSAWVEDMVIAENFRAQGIGRQLLQAALSWAQTQGATRAQLLVDVDNAHAIGYYKHLGWQTSNMNMRRILLNQDFPLSDFQST